MPPRTYISHFWTLFKWMRERKRERLRDKGCVRVRERVLWNYPLKEERWTLCMCERGREGKRERVRVRERERERALELAA